MQVSPKCLAFHCCDQMTHAALFSQSTTGSSKWGEAESLRPEQRMQSARGHLQSVRSGSAAAAGSMCWVGARDVLQQEQHQASVLPVAEWLEAWLSMRS